MIDAGIRAIRRGETGELTPTAAAETARAWAELARAAIDWQNREFVG
jgi:hypothetical protein